MLVSALRSLDKILRGDATRLAELKTGQLDIPLRQIVPVLVLLAALYGAAMGLFSTLHGGHPQAAVNALKFPALFLLTLLVTFPSLYVFTNLVGSRLTPRTLLNTISAALGVLIAILASLAPILVFFTLSTRSLPFMLLLNGANFLIAAVWGRSFLARTMHALMLSDPSTTDETSGTVAALPTPHDARSPEVQPASQELAAPCSGVSPSFAAAALSDPPPNQPTIPLSQGEAPLVPHPPDTSELTAGASLIPPSDTPTIDKAMAETEDPETKISDLGAGTFSPFSQGAPAKVLPRQSTPAARRPTFLSDCLSEASPSQTLTTVLRAWLCVFVVIGLQMIWLLGPFVGNPQSEFLWFHPPGEGNFLQGFWNVLTSLFG